MHSNIMNLILNEQVHSENQASMNQSSQKALHLSADKVRHDPVHSDYLWLELILSNDYDDKTTTPNCPVMGGQGAKIFKLPFLAQKYI